MSDKLDFSLPEKKKERGGFSLTHGLLLVLIAMSLVIFFTLQSSQKASDASKVLDIEAQKEFAMKLQKHNLNREAAQAWKNYLDRAQINKKESSNIWYSVGKLFQKAGDYKEAIESYYKSEFIYKNKTLENEISRRVQECYESLGNFAALRSELTDRVGLNENKDAIVLAEIGDMKITSTDLDQKIEEMIDMQLSQIAPHANPEQLKKQKEQLFKQFSGKDQRLQMLNQTVSEELLYREARKNQLAEDPQYKKMVKNLERKMLAQRLLSQELASKINITSSDLKSYYEANKGSFIKEGKQLSLEEAQQEVYMAMRKEKEGELSQMLFQKLKEEHNVVIHLHRIGQLYMQNQNQEKNAPKTQK